MKTLLTILAIVFCSVAMGQKEGYLSAEDWKLFTAKPVLKSAVRKGDKIILPDGWTFATGDELIYPYILKDQVQPDTIKVRILLDDGRAYPTQVNAWLFYSEVMKGNHSEIDAVYLEADKKKRITQHVWLFWVFEWKK